ncbi:hypothetical protein PO909_002527 [Leuciscus waleckii]
MEPETPRVPTEKPVDLPNVPKEYLDLKEVFSKSRAASLPPHRPFDCAIELLPVKIIHPSSSPAGGGFFIVDNKDGSLRPCIDYRGLNNITAKNTQLAAPLTALTSTKMTFRWSSAAAFSNLKSRFVSAPILVTPDPSCQFLSCAPFFWLLS